MGKCAGGWMLSQAHDGRLAQPSKRAWIEQLLLRAITEGSLRAGDRLPAARTLAREWGVSRGVVDEAFAELQTQGLIERRVGDGSYIARRLPPLVARAGTPLRPPSAAAQRVLSRISPMMAAAEAVRVNADARLNGVLGPGMTDADSFDLGPWRRALMHAYGEGQRRNLGYGSSTGHPALRESTARFLGLSRGLRCSAEQVMILHSPTHALELLARVLFEPGQTVCVEEPSFVGVPRIFALAGLRVSTAPIDDDGFNANVARSRHARPAGIYANVLNQFPTTRWTNEQRRRELLQWAHDSDAWVIEADYFNEIVYAPSTPPTLQRLDDEERVIYMGSYNAVMFSSLRIAYLVLPPRLMPLMTAVRGFFGDHTNVANQVAVARYIDEGLLTRRIRALQQMFSERHLAWQQASRRCLPTELQPLPLRGGATCCLPLPPSLPDVAVAQAANALGIAAEALSAHCWAQPAAHGLALGFGNTPAAQIEPALRRLAALLRDQFANTSA
jgi:GntR family transcriptional regulator / MocR family aminotransferase